MRLIKLLIALLFTSLFTYLLNTPPAQLPVLGKQLQSGKAATLPAIGQFLSPSHGFWQNASSKNLKFSGIQHADLKDKVDVTFDDRLVPHLFAQNDHDLYFAQGYVTAQLRLWQMEFITYAAAGRLSEIVGARALDLDKKTRRLGLHKAAEQTIALQESDPVAAEVIEAYTAGVNAYIEQLSDKELPIEYKLLNYRPEPWSPYKSALLLKSMSNDLTGRNHDIEHTNALVKFGMDDFMRLYPDVFEGQDPIIPNDKVWDFEPVLVDTTEIRAKLNAEKVDMEKQAQLFPPMESDPFFDRPIENLGSNNWAVSGERSASGHPILCNDPHLRLRLPSIWVEMQLQTPDMNVYGVTLPGSPNIVIGFNEHIAWGVTNAGRDIKDYYRIAFSGEERTHYVFNGERRPITRKKETYKVRHEADVEESILYTHHGPMPFADANTTSGDPKEELAMRWQANYGSNEMRTFYDLNRSKNYDDYRSALKTYECPAQNFVFASKTGDIAISQQGKFPVKWERQGKAILNGWDEINDWHGYIPFEHNPYIKNPGRGFVSSANQHPAAPNYPYYYAGPTFEFYRNRRLNQQLSIMDDATVEAMKQLQNDNYNLLAAETLPVLLSYLNEGDLNEQELKAYRTLKAWNFMNDHDQLGPSIFEAWFTAIEKQLWDELEDKERPMVMPAKVVSSKFMTTLPDDPFMDKVATPEKETAKDIARSSFQTAVIKLMQWSENNSKEYEWGAYRGLVVQHMARIDAFSHFDLPIGGNKGILNATSQFAGPSWRMVVELGDKMEAWGVYPGGQDGNPGSPYYDDMLGKWAKGEYYKLNFYKQVPSEDSEQVLDTYQLTP